jgi:DNA transformation protein
MVASAECAALLADELAPLGSITTRRMFGKTGVFCEGVMLGMVTEDVLYLRVDDQNAEAFEEAASSPPLSYVKQGRTIDLSFWRAPDRLFDDHEELLAWAREALAAAHRVAAKRGKPRRRGRPRPTF